MKYKNDYLKTYIIKTNTDRVTGLKSTYMDFYLYCDSDGYIYKLVCKDFAVKYNFIKGVESLGHKAIDFDRDVINIIVIKDKYEYKYKMHYLTFISLIEDLKLELKRNINMKEKVLKWANKGGFEAFYNIMNN